MDSQGYYRIEGDTLCSIRVTDRPLAVNCTGLVSMTVPFSAHMPQGRHDFYLMFLRKGHLQAESGACSFLLSPGQVYIYPPETRYAYHNRNGEEILYDWVHFSGTDAEALLQRVHLPTGQIHTPDSPDKISSLFQEIFRCFRLREEFFEEESSGLLAAMVTRIGRWCGQTQPPARGIRRLQTSLDYLHQKYSNPIRLEELAAMEHLSPSRYSALFRTCMGVSPQTFLIGLRIQNAAVLLCSTDLPVLEIARASGYEDALYFSTLFRRKTGFSPTEYRRRFGETHGSLL